MKLRNVFLAAVLILIIAFVALNWNAFLATTTVSFGVATIVAPLGMIMLGLLAVLAAVFLTYIVTLQTTVLLEARRHARELQAHRELADRAEASRFTELRRFIEGELQAVAVRDAESNAAMQARIDRLEQKLSTSLEESGNSMAAQLGEIEDRLEREAHRPVLPATVIRREH